jgi:hypothetical protein
MHVNAEFQLSTCYPDRLRQIFDLLQENFRVFQKNSLANFRKFQI